MMNTYTPTRLLKSTVFSLAILLTNISLFAQQQGLKTATQTLHYDEENQRIPFSFPQDQALITLCGLEVGVEYELLATVFNQPDCNFKIDVYTGNSDDESSNPNAVDFSELTKFTAATSCVQFYISDTNCSNLEDLSLDLSVMPTYCKPVDDGVVANSVAVLSTDYNFSIEELITEVFIGGGCFDVTNVELIGNTNGVGHFTNGTTNVGFEDGIILASGNIANAEGPNNSGGAGTSFGDSSGDPDLNLFGAGSVRDAVGIEFDFTPTLDVINFDYVFGSEEYCEYVNSTFNDVFGFFISGPGFNGPFTGGAENIALVPGTGNYVAINSINHLVNTTYFVPNSGGCGGTTNAAEIEYDGYTTVLTATANVIPCETYHIRLVVSDIGDHILDSGVFLKANSFDAGGQAGVDVNIPSIGSDGVAYEGCSSGQIIFERDPESILDLDYIVEFTIDPASTATNGVDYSNIPSPVTIPAGQASITIPFDVFEDGIFEGPENIIISLDNPCSCESSTVEILIDDLIPLEVELEDITACGSAEVELTPVVIGGVPDLLYQWSTGETTPTIIVNTSTNNSYTLTVSDVCGTIVSATALVEITPESTASLSGEAFVCAENTVAELEINFTGQGPWEIYYTQNGAPIGPITNITQNPYTLIVDGAGEYELLSVSGIDGVCPGEVDGYVVIEELFVEIYPDVFDVTCNGNDDGSIFVVADGGTPGYLYDWSTGDGGTFLEELAPGNYTVTATDANGCTAEQSFTINNAPEIIADLTTDGLVDCQSPEGGSIDLTVSGGLPIYDFFWNTGDETEDLTNLTVGTYTVTVFDSNGCTTEATIGIDGNFDEPTAVATVDGLIDCTGGTASVSGSGSSGSGGSISYEWYLGGVLVSTSETFEASETGNYVLVITDDVNGCTSEAAAQVDTNMDEPTAIANPLNQITCIDSLGTLDAAGSSGNGTLTYEWYNAAGTLVGTGQTIEVPAGGNYTLVVTDQSNGCTSDAVASISESQNPPVPVIIPPGQLDCNTTTVLIDGSGSSGDGSESYQWYFNGTPIDQADSINVENPGDYSLIITNGINGCTAEASVSVTQNITPPPATINTPNQLTCNDSIVLLSTSVSGTLEWQDGTGTVIGNGTDVEVTEPGTYVLLVTDGLNGCTADATVQVTENIADPIAVTGADGILDCGGAAANLSGAGSSTGTGITYEWFNDAGVLVGTTIDIDVTEIGTYTLVVTDGSNGCSSEATSLVAPDTDLPNIEVVPPVELTCSNDMATLIGSSSSTGNIEYGWYFGGTLISADPTTDVLEPGVYTFVVTNADNGCESEATVEVVQNEEEPMPLPEVDGILSCADGAVFLNANGSEPAGSIEYEWLNSVGDVISTEELVEVSEAGEYTLVVTNTLNGCTAEMAATVDIDEQAPTPVAVPDGVITCDEGMVTIDGSGSSGTGDLTYEWIYGGGVIATDPSIEVEVSGTYTLIITNELNGCTATIDAIVDENQEVPIAQIDPVDLLDCVNEMVTINAGGSTGNGDISLEWLNEAGDPIGTGTSIEVDEAGAYTVIVTNDDNGCTAEASINVDQNDEAPVPTAANDGVLTCVNEMVTLTGSSSGTGTITYEWSGPGGALGTDNPVTVNEPGTYTLVVTDSDNGCTETTTVEVDENLDTPTAVAGPDGNLTCTEDEVTLDGEGSSTGSDIIYEWESPGGIIVSTDLTADVSEIGTYTLVVTNTESGCSEMATVEVIPDLNLPVVQAGLPQELNCNIEMVTISGSVSGNGPFEYEWVDVDDIPLGSELEQEVTEEGVYTLIVTNSDNGCTSSASVLVSLDLEEPTADAGTDQLLDCGSTSVTLDGTNSSAPAGGSFEYEWTSPTGIVISTEGTIDVAEAGTYQLVITGENGCTSLAEVEVNLDDDVPQPVAVNDGILTCVNDVVNLSGTVVGGGTIVYEWLDENGVSIGTNNPISISTPGVYTLNALNQDNGCSGTTTVVVEENLDTPAAVAGPDDMITCTETVANLDGTGSSVGPDITYQWLSPGGVIVSTEITADVTEIGVYTIIVTNETSGCTQTAMTEVTPDANLPIADAGLPQLLDCNIEMVTLSSAGSSTGSEINYEWFDPNGTLISTEVDIDVAEPGTYVLEITNTTNGCTATASVQVDQDLTPPLADAGAPQLIDCDVSVVTLNGAASDGIAFEWLDENGVTISTNETVDVEVEGTYQLVITGANGCTSMDEVDVSIDTNVPIAEAGLGGLLTCVQNVITLGDIGTSTGPGITYEWLDENNQVVGTEATLDVTLPGTYTLNVYNALNNCESTAEATVTEDQDYPIADPGVTGTLTCDLTEIMLGGTGTTTGPEITYSWLNDAGTEVGTELELEVTVAGVYTLVVSNTTNDCISTASIEVDDYLDPPTANAGQNQLLTCDIMAVNLDGSGSMPNSGLLEYEWTNAGGVVVGTTPMVNVEEAGIYQLLVTGDNGCTAIANVEVEVDANVPVADAGPGGQLDCNVGMITIGGSSTSSGAGIVYEWTNSLGEVVGTTPTLDVTLADTYVLTVFNQNNNCDISSSVEVMEDLVSPVADPGLGGLLTCDVLEINLGGGATSTGLGIEYIWENELGDVVGTDIELNVTESGTYTLYVNNMNNGCSSNQEITINQDILDPTADAGAPGVLTCETIALVLDGSGSSVGSEFTYEWYNSNNVLISTDLNPTITEADDYTLIVTNTMNACTAASLVSVIPDENLPTALAAMPNMLTCTVLEVALDGTASTTTSGQIGYEWQDDTQSVIATTSNTMVSQPGIYTLVITDPNNGCTTTTTVDVPQNIEDPTAFAGNPATITCDQTDVTLNGSGTGNALQYEWFNSSNISIGTSPNVTVDIVGTYTLVVTDGMNGCTALSTVEVLPDNNIPVAEAGDNGVLTCVTDQVVLNATGSSTGTNITYEWLSPSGISLGSDPTITVTEIGAYTLIVYDANNDCSSQDQVFVSDDMVAPIPDITPIGATSITCETSAVVLDGSFSAPFGDLTFMWSTANGNILTDPTAPQVEANEPGTYNLVVTNTINGCTEEMSFDIGIDVEQPVAAVAQPPILTCALESFNLDGNGSSTNGDFEYLWTSSPAGGIMSGGTTLNPVIDQAGVFTLTVTNNENGCVSTTSITVAEDIELPDAAANVDDILDCLTESVSLSGNGSSSGAGYSYLWTGAGLVNGETTLNPEVNAAGSYMLLVTDQNNGCTETAVVEVEENPDMPVDLNLDPTPPLCFGNLGTLGVVSVTGGEGPYTYSLDGEFYSGDTVFAVPSGYTTVYVQDLIGCTYEEEIYVADVIPVGVEVEAELSISLGEGTQLNAITNIPASQIDTIIWTPTDSLSCENCLDPYANPTFTTTYTVTVINDKGCDDTAEIRVEVKKDRDIYIPNAFSPNGDGINDIFTIYTNGKSVKQINELHVYNRWGEEIFENSRFQPDDEAHGWNGMFREELMNPGVFVYWCEIEFEDGFVKLYKGDVTIVR